MKTFNKIIITYFLASAFIFMQAQNIITVNNIVGSIADYNNLQEAIDSASTGDIIHLYPSGSSYGNITLEKQIAIYGMGYFVGANNEPNTQATIGETNVGFIDFSDGSSGSIAQGMTINSYISFRNVSNINISHCKILSYLLFSSSSSSNNVSIKRCFLSYSGINLTSGSSHTGLVLENNIIECSASNFYANSISSISGISMKNNSIYLTNNSSCALRFTNIIFENNIIVADNTNLSISSGYEPISYSYNITSDTIFSGCATCEIHTASDIFEGFPSAGGSSQDYRFTLKATSPAKNFSSLGEDIGAFGGSSPYRLSGIPDIPNIYYLDVPSSGSSVSGINIRVKARANE